MIQELESIRSTLNQNQQLVQEIAPVNQEQIMREMVSKVARINEYLNDLNDHVLQYGPGESFPELRRRNPLLEAYHMYTRDTPIVSRYIINATIISYIVSTLLNITMTYYDLPKSLMLILSMKFSPLICTSIISLVLTFIGFYNHGGHVERTIGSTLFAILLCRIAILTHVLSMIISVLPLSKNDNDSDTTSSSPSPMDIVTLTLSIIVADVDNVSLPLGAIYCSFFVYHSMATGVRLSNCLGLVVGYVLRNMDNFSAMVETVRRDEWYILTCM